MSVIEESINFKTGPVDNKEHQNPFLLIPNWPATLSTFVENDDPLHVIFPREVIDRWNDMVRENLRNGKAVAESMDDAFLVNSTYDSPAFMPDDYIAELPPADVIGRMKSEAKK